MADKIKLYIPVCAPPESEGGPYFTVNGASDESEEEACKKARKHVSFQRGAKIVRIDVIEDYFQDPTY